MVSSCVYTLNGTVIDSDNCKVIVGSGLYAPVSTVRDVLTVTGRHGSVPTGVRGTFEERSLTLKVDAFAPEVFAQSQRLMRMCATPNLRIGRIMDGVNASTRAELESLTPDDDSSHPNKMVGFTAVFALPDVFWREDTVSDIPLSLNGQTKGTWGSAPLTNPIFRLPANVGRVEITDGASNTGVIWSGTPTGNWLYIDAANLRAWKSAESTAWSGSNSMVSTGLDYPAGGIMECWPDASGTYSVTVKTSGGSGQCVMHAARAWW